MKAGVTKKEFIASLEQTLKLTRENVLGLELISEDVVVLRFVGGHEKLINIAMNSGMAIIRDVAKYV